MYITNDGSPGVCLHVQDIVGTFSGSFGVLVIVSEFGNELCNPYIQARSAKLSQIVICLGHTSRLHV
jgi:hypothetical protein